MWDIEKSSIHSIFNIWNSSHRYPKKNKIQLILEEHCTECSIPDCYSTCVLYSPKIDKTCRRFDGGISYTRKVDGYEIRFKRWAKLEGEILGVSTSSFQQALLESLYYFQIKVTSILFSQHLALKWRERSKRWLKRILKARTKSFRYGNLKVHLRITNPGKAMNANLQYSNSQGTLSRKSVYIPNGYTENFIHLTEAQDRNMGDSGQYISFTPQEDSPTELIFHEFSVFIDQSENIETDVSKGFQGILESQEVKTIKCVIWDLDNTLWDGVLTEDGLEGIKIKFDIPRIIRELDSRGILQAVSSKNDNDLAIQALTKFGLVEYFIAAEINWNQKSNSITQISKKLNLGVDSFLFVDDSEFERIEVSSRFPSIRTTENISIEQLKGDKSLSPIVTPESRNRRRMYQQDFSRQETRVSYGDNYLDYLRDCLIEMELRNIRTDLDRERAFELLSRTNQLNLSGRKFTLEEFTQDLVSKESHWIIGKVQDKFGDYGNVLIVRYEFDYQGNSTVTDLAISCRVAERMIEPALFKALFTRFEEDLIVQVSVNFVSTERNTPIRNALEILGFNLDEKNPKLSTRHQLPHYDIVKTNWI